MIHFDLKKIEINLNTIILTVNLIVCVIALIVSVTALGMVRNLPVNESIPTVETESTTVLETEETVPETTPEAPSEAPSVPVTEETLPPINQDELEMLACVIYQEAGGNRSCDDCRRYVADIVLNRIEHPKFPDTMEAVLTAANQYGRFHYTGIKWPERAQYDTEKEAVARAYQIAEEVLRGHHSQLYGQGYIWQAKFVQGTDGFWCCGHFYGR